MPLPDNKPSQSRQDVLKQLEQETSERLSHIDSELIEGYNLAHKYNHTITVMGSARFTEENKYYQKAREVSGALSKQGYTIVTGGGPGIMEAANRGAFEADCPSVGLGIQLPHEQSLNKYVTDSFNFRYFFARKVMMSFGAEGFLFFPGGFGTFDEMFEIITLVQTHKMPAVPMILVGVDYWRDLQSFIQLHMLHDTKVISPGDEQLYTITDDTQQILDIMNTHREQHSALAQTKSKSNDQLPSQLIRASKI